VRLHLLPHWSPWGHGPARRVGSDQHIPVRRRAAGRGVGADRLSKLSKAARRRL